MKFIVIGGCAALVALAISVAIKWDDFFVKPPLRAGIESAVKDPSSVLYRNEALARQASVLCGEFNAKNGYGAYVGFKRFLSDQHRFAVEGNDTDSWVGKDPSTDWIVQKLDMRNAVIRSAIQVAKDTGAKLSDEAVDEMVNKRAFAAIWQKECSPPVGAS